LGDAGAAGLLGFLEQVFWDFNSDFARCSHNAKLYHMEGQH
jgi:hypothetical protein